MCACACVGVGVGVYGAMCVIIVIIFLWQNQLYQLQLHGELCSCVHVHVYTVPLLTQHPSSQSCITCIYMYVCLLSCIDKCVVLKFLPHCVFQGHTSGQRRTTATPSDEGSQAIETEQVTEVTLTETIVTHSQVFRRLFWWEDEYAWGSFQSTQSPFHTGSRPGVRARYHTETQQYW